MSATTTPKARFGRLAAAGAVLTALLGPGAGAQPTNEDNPFRGIAPDCFVYHSRDGDGYYDFPRVLPVGSHSLGLWATAGALTTAEPDCEPGPQPGTGEICFVSFVIERTGGGTIDGFTFSGDLGMNGATSLSTDQATLTVNLTTATDPLPGGFVPSSAPVRIGDLAITVASDTVVNLTSGTCLGLGGANLDVAAHTIAVPEPGEYLLLASGLLGLVALYQLHLRRSRSA